MFFLFKDFAATLFSFEVWIAYLRLSESAKLDVLNGWLNKNTFPTWGLAWSQSWEDTNWLICPFWTNKSATKTFGLIVTTPFQKLTVWKFHEGTYTLLSMLSICLIWGDWGPLSVRLFIVRWTFSYYHKHWTVNSAHWHCPTCHATGCSFCEVA